MIECTKAFNGAKKAISSTGVLVHYDPNLQQLTLAGDASAYGIGAVISHVLPDGSEKPIAFASRTLTASECNTPFSHLRGEEISPISLWSQIPINHGPQTPTSHSGT